MQTSHERLLQTNQVVPWEDLSAMSMPGQLQTNAVLLSIENRFRLMS